MDTPATDPKADSLKTLTTVVYALQAASFVLGITAIIAVVLNYVKRDDVRGTWLESHFSWQIRTFWFALLWALFVGLVSLPLSVILVGIGTWIAGLFLLGVWAIYRIARGWLNLKDGRPMPLQ